ncbi:MAG: hypothetical protein KKF00_04090, partial [Proteobacteria bacterium]|nr:hypothetical protein [Pseudomonadota bacterium]
LAATATSCYSCHASGITTATAYASSTSKNVHHPDPGGDCIGCHSSVQGARRAITAAGGAGEFALAWSHKKTASNIATYPTLAGRASVYDCGVCHMEGTAATGAINATYHKVNGVELRNPDLGTALTGYASFSRNLGITAFEAWVTNVQTNFCLKCHDIGGAGSALARVPGGTAEKPFGTTIAGAGYTGAGVTANGVVGGVTDIKEDFTTTYASYHPVLGTQNNSYTDIDTMVAPWNSITKVSGTPSAGNLISCWDCHSGGINTGTASGASLSGHGVATTLRAAYDRVNGQATKLCVACHKTGVYWTGSTFPAGTAFSTSATTADAETHPNTAGTTSRHVVAETFFNGCIACHSSAGSDAVQPARPRASADAHGFNTLVAGGNWATLAPATAGAPPFAFFRATNAMTSWRPKSWPTQTAPADGACDGNNMCGRGESTYNYQPGGAY